MTGPAYGAFVDQAAQHVGAATMLPQRFTPEAEAHATLAAYNQLLAALREHLAFLLGPRLDGRLERADPDPRMRRS